MNDGASLISLIENVYYCTWGDLHHRGDLHRP